MCNKLEVVLNKKIMYREKAVQWLDLSLKLEVEEEVQDKAVM